MTEAKKKNTQSAHDDRISTHPSYTEYSWDSLVGSGSKPENVGGASVAALPKGRNVTRSTAAVRRPLSRPASPAVDTKKKRTFTPTSHTAASAAKVRAEEKTAVEKTEKVKTKRKISIHTISVDKKYSFPLSIVLVALCFTFFIMSIVTTAVRINEITAVNSDLDSRYNAMVSEENELKLLLETRDDLRIVEQMAKEELGMVKIDQVERYYLTVHQEDKIEIIEDVEEQQGGFFDSIAEFGSSLFARIRGFFGM